MSNNRLEPGDKVRFKVAHYTQNRAAKVETDEVKEGEFICFDGQYLAVRVGTTRLPYLVHPDDVIQKEVHHGT